MMQNSIFQFIAWLPEGAVWVIPLTLVFLLSGWISSIVIAVKSKWLALFAVFPITNPIAVIGMMYKHTTASMVPIGFYALALTVWVTGGNRSRTIEFERLRSYEQMLKDQGEPIRAADYNVEPGEPEKNVWNHPFLKTLAEAGQNNSAGELARERMDREYSPLQLPNPRIKIKYEEVSKDRRPMLLPIQSLHELAIGIQLDGSTAPNNIKLPSTPFEAAKSLEAFFHKTQPALHQLQEAVSRPNDAYPFEWDEGFNLLLPHLAKLRAFTKVAHLHSVMSSVLGNQDASFQKAKLILKLSETGDSDILISRLVQFAQLSISLETLVAAQNYHAWTDAQWLEIRDLLDSYKLIHLMPDSLRAERALGRSSIEPLLTQNWSGALQKISQLGSPQQPPFEGMLKGFMDRVMSRFSQAFLAKQWRMCLEAYTFMIDDLEKAVDASENQPWKNIHISWEDQDLKAKGLFASMMLPALGNAQSKAVLTQSKLELAKTAINLERFYLKHEQYPDTLEALVPAFAPALPMDPLTGLAYIYKKSGIDGFEIYSAGLNGKDEGGRNMTKIKSSEPTPPDDLLWVIGDESKNIPPYTLH